jgi:uncharacterized repeat protein (TIGR04076 family)
MEGSKNVNDDEVIHLMDVWYEPVSFKVKIVKDGNCRADHKKGQFYEFEWNTPEGMCGESFVGMYPLLHSLRVLGDMRELGSSERNIRIYTCPSRVIQFRIEAIYRCSLCGKTLPIKSGNIVARKIENKENDLWVRVCSDCFKKHQHKILKW